MNYNQADIRIIPGRVAPRTNAKPLRCTGVVVTEQGTEAGLPIVDFMCVDDDGQEYMLMFTGRIVNAISATVRGVNMRIHGMDEP